MNFEVFLSHGPMGVAALLMVLTLGLIWRFALLGARLIERNAEVNQRTADLFQAMGERLRSVEEKLDRVLERGIRGVI